MGKCERSKSKKKNGSNWRWENFKKKTFANKNRETFKTLEKVQKEPLNKNDLLHFVKNTPNFIGIYASDAVLNLSILKYPVSLIVNLDISRLEGSHWLSIYINRKSVEIFDSLGMNPKLWGSYPSAIFKFLAAYSFSHNFYISPVIQPPFTLTCGLSCG